MRVFIPGFHCQMENNKAAPSAPPQRGGAEGAAPLGFAASHLAVETRNKNLMEIYFVIKARPNFWPQTEKPTLGGAGP